MAVLLKQLTITVTCKDTDSKVTAALADFWESQLLMSKQ